MIAAIKVAALEPVVVLLPQAHGQARKQANLNQHTACL